MSKNFILFHANHILLILVVTLGLSNCCYAERLLWPVRGRVTSHFGWRQDPFGKGLRFHAGMDIAAPTGTRIVAVQRGIVAYSGWYGGYGNLIAIAHGHGLYTLYGHASKLYVQQNQFVEPGQMIASVGSTGRSTGPHLHFEVHQNGHYLYPHSFLANLK